jgi:uncharacterized protein (TIGR02300 family)
MERRTHVSKPEWGTKRVCQGCGVRFYDLNRSQIVCPKCGTVNSAEPPAKLRRAAPRPIEPARPAPAPVEPEAGLIAEGVTPASLEVEDEEEKDKDEEVIEDTSDLGEDEDDVAEVKEHIEPEGGR